ncbi:MAG: sugar transferase [Thermotogota bacterium]
MFKKLKLIEIVMLLIINFIIFQNIGLSIFYTLAIYIGLYAFKLFDNDTSITPSEIIIRYFSGFLASSFLIFIISIFSNYLLDNYNIFKLFLSSILIPFIHIIFFRYERKYVKPIRYIVFGKKNYYKDILKEISDKSRDNLLFVSYFDSLDDLVIFNNNVNFDKILIANPFMPDKIKKFIDENNIQKDYITTISEKYLKRISLKLMYSFDEYYKIFFSEKEEPKFKRFIDIFLSILFLIIFSPIMFLISIFIFVESGTPLIFEQKRFGKNEKPFYMIKFRTMDDKGNILKSGKIIRKIRIDEILQFVNVIKGDMSIVGPRPEIEKFHLEMKKKINYYNLRYQTNPGITGWAQIYYKYTQNLEDYKRKTEYDLYYIKNRNIMLDLQIMLKTIETMFFHKGE